MERPDLEGKLNIQDRQERTKDAGSLRQSTVPINPHRSGSTRQAARPWTRLALIGASAGALGAVLIGVWYSSRNGSAKPSPSTIKRSPVGQPGFDSSSPTFYLL